MVSRRKGGAAQTIDSRRREAGHRPTAAGEELQTRRRGGRRWGHRNVKPTEFPSRSQMVVVGNWRSPQEIWMGMDGWAFGLWVNSR
jgi:hypothetical protein